jgi:hypothetical protein
LRYNAYLIRLWEEGVPGVWRASAQHAQSGEIVRFAYATELLAFLQAQMVDAPPMPSAVVTQATAEQPIS